MKKLIVIAAVFCMSVWLGMGLQAQKGGLGVIINKANKTSSINTNILRNIYLGKRGFWPDNQPIHIAILKKGDVHSRFLKVIVKMNASRFSLHWKKATYTGTGVAPKVFESEEKLRAFVSETPGAIGYISLDALDDTVKKLSIK